MHSYCFRMGKMQKYHAHYIYKSDKRLDGRFIVRMTPCIICVYSDAMVRLTYRRVGDWHLAEDLVQETFLTACCKSERVCGHKKPVAWLFETLNNLTLRESRRFYHTEVSIEDIAESYELTELPMACHIPMGLSGSEQEIILLRIDKGYSFLELAEHFGISEMACRQRLSRALRKCRTLLEDPLGSTPK